MYAILRFLIIISIILIPIQLHALDLSNELSFEKRNIDVKKVKELILKGADVNSRNQYGYTPLMIASLRGLREIAEILIAHGAEINAKAELGETALMGAAERGHLEIAEILISKGADINASDQNERTAISAAATNGKKQMVEFLLAKGANLSGKQKLLNSAIFGGHLELVKLIVSQGAAINGGNDPDTAPLMEAAGFGRTEIAAFLLSKGADANTKNSRSLSALMYAASKGYTETASLLIARGADVNAVTSDDNMTALLYAAKKGMKDLVQLLISKGADVNAKDRTGKTALLYAYEGVHKETEELLVANGAIDTRPKDEFLVITRDGAPLRLLPKEQAKPVGNARIGDYCKFLEATTDARWFHVSKGNKSYWVNFADIYREPKKLKASITQGFKDVRIGKPVTPNPKMPFAIGAEVEILDYAVAMDILDKESKKLLEEKSIVSSYKITSDAAISTISEQLYLSKTIVKDSGCYSENKYVGTDSLLLNEKTYEVKEKSFSKSFSLPRKELFSTKLNGTVLNAKFVYIFKIKYADGSDESVVRAVNLSWPLCM